MNLQIYYLEHLEDTCISGLDSHYIEVFSIHFAESVGKFGIVPDVLVSCRHGYDRRTNGCILGYGGTVQGVVEPRPVVVDVVDDDCYCCTCWFIDERDKVKLGQDIITLG